MYRFLTEYFASLFQLNDDEIGEIRAAYDIHPKPKQNVGFDALTFETALSPFFSGRMSRGWCIFSKTKRFLLNA